VIDSNSSSSAVPSPSRLSRSDLAALIRRLPDGPEKSLATRAFQLKYAGKPDPHLSARALTYAGDPVSWVRDKCKEYLWSKQREIFASVLANRRTAVHSCHDSGKSYLAARIACHWLDTHRPGEAFVVTTAPTNQQVKAILWREIGRAHAKAKLFGRLNQTEWWAQMPAGNEEMIAFGRKPDDMKSSDNTNTITAFQGIHAPFVLVILDEACGITSSLWEAADTLISNTDSHILAIGNPDDPQSEFAKVCAPGSGWNVIHISAFDTPNFTQEEIPEEYSKVFRSVLISPEWVEEKKRKWGEKNPLYLAKVLGLFPEFSTDGLIPMQWVKRAQEIDLSKEALLHSHSAEIGMDVGGGTNKSTIALRNGPQVRIVHSFTTPNTMEALSYLLNTIESSYATVARVDYIGVGRGVVDRAQEMANDQALTLSQREIAAKVVGIEVGRPAEDSEHFVNLRAEGYWTLRTRFEEGSIDIDGADEDLAAQLVGMKWQPKSGRIQIESKEDMAKRGLASPDEADAVMLAFLPDYGRNYDLTWGKRR
jgi:hypothetical protein